MDLSIPYYAISIWNLVRTYVDVLDPLLQVGVVSIALAAVSQGSALVVALGLGVLVFLRLSVLDEVGPGKAKDPRDAAMLTTQVLEDELKALDPDGRFPNLFASPALFHLFHQVLFLKDRGAETAFDDLLDAADWYLEASREIRSVDNLTDVGELLGQAIARADAVVRAYRSIALSVPLSADREIAWRFKDTLAGVRGVLDGDLAELREIARKHVSRTPTSFEPLPKLGAPRAAFSFQELLRDP